MMSTLIYYPFSFRSTTFIFIETQLYGNMSTLIVLDVLYISLSVIGLLAGGGRFFHLYTTVNDFLSLNPISCSLLSYMEGNIPNLSLAPKPASCELSHASGDY